MVYTIDAQSFTVAEVAVLEALHAMEKIVKKMSGVDLYTTYNGGISFVRAIQFLFKDRNIAADYKDVLHGLEKMQWIYQNNGLYYSGKLCSCGRCNKYVHRAGKKLGTSKDGRVSAALAEVFSGKKLNWTDNETAVYKAEHNITEPQTRKVRSKKSKQAKLKTAKVVAKVWNETNGNTLKKEFNKRQRLLKILEQATLTLMEME